MEKIFNELKANELKVLIWLYAFQKKMFYVTDLDDSKMGMAKSSVYRVINQLVDKGWIDKRGYYNSLSLSVMAEREKDKLIEWLNS